jgi:hypothetical protein
VRVGERAKVVSLERPVPTKEDRSSWVGHEGLVVRRLNVPWTPDHGALWELRFDSGDVVVFADSELTVVRNGQEQPSDLEAVREAWGEAPRGPSLPFRRLGTNVGTGPAVLALLIFALAGILLLWAGIASGNWWYGAAGGVLVLIGVGAAGALVA